MNERMNKCLLVVHLVFHILLQSLTLLLIACTFGTNPQHHLHQLAIINFDAKYFSLTLLII